jgi:uncharacterized protein
MTKKKITEMQTRLDWYEDIIDYATAPATKTDEGFLIARAPVTSIGVFTYRNPDGSFRRELRLPEEVFNSDSLETLKLKPLTKFHPDEKIVTTANVENLQVGSVGSDISCDSYRVYTSLVVTRADSVKAVEDGSARSLSCGYTCDIDWTSGTWMGMDYDCIQRNIKYNHVALVPTGRAGDGNAVRMDAGEVELPKTLNKENEDNMNLKTIRLDGADFQAEPQVIAALTVSQTRVDAVEKELAQLRADAKAESEKLTAEKSALEAERDTLKERLDSAEKAMPAKIEEAVKARVDLMSMAAGAGVEVKNDASDLDIKKEIILKQFPAANLDGKDDAYIAARLDAACELMKVNAENKSRVDAAETSKTTNLSVQEKLDKAKASYNSRMDAGWKDQ